MVLPGLEVKVRTEQRSSETGKREFKVVEAGRSPAPHDRLQGKLAEGVCLCLALCSAS